MPKVSNEHKQERRDQIMLAAAKCFSEKGFHACSMQDICHEAELSPGAVYSYFQGKEQIIQSMVESSKARQDEVFARLNIETGSVRAAIGQLKDFYFGQISTEPEAITCMRMDLMLVTEGLTDMKLMQLYQGVVGKLVDTMAELLRQGKVNGELKPDVDETAAAQALYALHQGLIAQVLIQQTVDMKAYHGVLDAMIDGLFNN